VIGTGQLQGIELKAAQPIAAAASEAHFETQDPADFSLIAGFTPDGKNVTWNVTIPKALSFLYYFKFEGEVEGLNDLQAQYQEKYGPGDYIPLVALTYWTFRLMVALGFLMALITLVIWFFVAKKFPQKGYWLLKILPFAIFFPYLANTAGWVLTETGRQPWTVTGLILTKDSVSPNLTVTSIWISLVGFVVVYGALMVVDLFLLLRNAKKGLAAGNSDSEPLDVLASEKTSGGK
jgi:cytochrome d ubiquinol oxidase subunit I